MGSIGSIKKYGKSTCLFAFAALLLGSSLTSAQGVREEFTRLLTVRPSKFGAQWSTGKLDGRFNLLYSPNIARLGLIENKGGSPDNFASLTKEEQANQIASIDEEIKQDLLQHTRLVEDIQDSHELAIGLATLHRKLELFSPVLSVEEYIAAENAYDRGKSKIDSQLLDEAHEWARALNRLIRYDFQAPVVTPPIPEQLRRNGLLPFSPAGNGPSSPTLPIRADDIGYQQIPPPPNGNHNVYLAGIVTFMLSLMIGRVYAASHPYIVAGIVASVMTLMWLLNAVIDYIYRSDEHRLETIHKTVSLGMLGVFITLAWYAFKNHFFINN